MGNILTSSDGDYWRLVRGAWMKCFTSTNLKRVSSGTGHAGGRAGVLEEMNSEEYVTCFRVPGMHI
jgi:hypothetical protein